MTPLPELVEVPAGEFLMGATKNDRFASVLELPRHAVRFKRGFAIGRTPVTRAQWAAYRRDVPTAHDPPPVSIPKVEPHPDWPVMGLNRADADGWLAWAGERARRPLRLPTEAEWEYAARAGTTTAFHTGEDLAISEANYLYDELARRVGPGHPTPVAAYPPNPWGLCDTLGSVSEWVADDWHPGYAAAPVDGRAWTDEPPGGLGVIRGGSWDLLPRSAPLRLPRRGARGSPARPRRLPHRCGCLLGARTPSPGRCAGRPGRDRPLS